MSQRFYGSINLSLLIEEAKKKHSAFTKHDNGNIYGNITVWFNDKEDKFGNIMSVQLSPTKERKDIDGNPYIANCKLATSTRAVSDRDTSDLDVDFEEEKKPPPIVVGEDDLPF